MFAVLAVALVFQQGTEVPSDTSRKDVREPRKLGSIMIRERATATHKYSAAWSSTATKTETPLRDTPQSVSVITSSLISEQSMQSMADVVRYMPGVTMGQGEGHRDAPTIRGNSSTADFFVDGIRDDVQYYRDLYNVERVELLAGSNAMVFGRGGGGGVINRVTKTAGWEPVREMTFEGGSFQHARATIDRGGAFNDRVAVRLNGMYQSSEGFRDEFALDRFGVSPSAAVVLGERTSLRFAGEYFEDRRTVDRGLPSFQGRPSAAPRSVFFGNPDSSRAELQLGNAGLTLEHLASERLSIRTHARVTAYDKFYQNVLPGAVDASGTQVNLSAYSNDTQRENYFGQVEATLRVPTARLPQTLLVGVEIGKQSTDNQRRTGYFDGASTSMTTPFDAPTVATSVTFRPSASDANNHVVANVASLYAQEQLWLLPQLQATAGVRFERFDLQLRDHRNGQLLDRVDQAFSPRVGLVYKPVTPVSLYSSYSVSFLPSAGDQFSGLNATRQTLEPERFANAEVGAKWSVLPQLQLTAAAYQLMRSNSAAPSALDPGVIVQTGKQKTTGYELSASGRVLAHWDVVGAFTTQRARIVSRTSAAPEGAAVPLVPRRTVSLWNRYQLAKAYGIGLGVISQSQMFAAIDNTVTLPGFTRLDAAAYLGQWGDVELQLNVENVLDEEYFATSHGNNNIMPGAPRTVRVSAKLHR